MNSQEILIVDALRTPVGNIDGSLASLTATQLGTTVVEELTKRYPIVKEKTDHLILGNSVSAGVGQNPARQIALLGGITPRANSYTVNQVCGSGLSVVGLSRAMMREQGTDVALAGAVESCSNMPYLLNRREKGLSNENTLIDSLNRDGLFCPIEDIPFGNLAEDYAQENGISREAQDIYALESQQRAAAARDNGFFDSELIQVSREEASLARDEKIRPTLTAQKMARLRPVYQKGGTITAGNASGLGDCGCIVFLSTRRFVEANGIAPMARIVDTYSLGTPLRSVFTGPAQVLEQLLHRNNLCQEDIGLFEVCESFSCAVLGFLQETKISPDKVNVYGGDIALGHPMGASGARLVVTLTHALKEKNKKYGVVLMSMGGGHSIGILLENLG